MADVKKMQEETIASIDTAKALVDKVLSAMELILVNPSLTKNFTYNPTKFLLQILGELGVTQEKIEIFLTNFLIYTLPTLEISVKAILLTNLKNMISCSVDPRIPEKYRKRHKNPLDPNTSQEYGIDINIESIDFLDKLSINPLGSFGNNWYFGLDGVTDSYKLARADDMDAFLWFVIHKGKFPNSSTIESIDHFINSLHHVTSSASTMVLPSDATLLSVLEVMYGKNNPSSVLPGNTFVYPNGYTISMCLENSLDEAENITHNTIVPVSDDWTSVNWYARRADQFGKNLVFGWELNDDRTSKYLGKGRNYSKERAICNIQYIDQASSDAPLTGLVNNKFRFTILPKPYIHKPILSQGEAPWQFKKMLFNDKGDFDPNGKYTFVEGSVVEEYSDDNVYFHVGGGEVDVVLNLTSRDVIVYREGATEKEAKEMLAKYLIECYQGLTVYEFNYDYVMSIKLFDAKVMVNTLFETLLNRNLGLNVGVSIRHEEATETIKQIIKNILETDESEVNDCYYTFDNSKYDSLLRKAEEKRARQQRFGNVTHESGVFDSVYDILNEYDANAELHVQEEVIHRTITQAAVTISEGADETNKLRLEYDFIFDLIEALTTAVVNSVLSPKVLMLLEVNQKIMGGTWEKFTFKDLLQALKSVIIAIVKEIRDIILQELLKLTIKELHPIIETLGSIIIREQLENYSEAILEITRWAKLINYFGFGGGQQEDTKLDNVDYADIDTTSYNNGEQPSTNNC